MRHLPTLTFISALILLSGCSSFSKSSSVDLKPIETSELSWSEQQNASELLALNDLVSSDPLNALVDQSLKNNAELQQALLSLQVVQQQYYQAKGEYLPAVEGNLSGSQTQNEERAYSGGISINWVVDLWGKVADQAHSAERSLTQQRSLLQQSRDALAGEVMQSWLTLIYLQHQINIGEERIKVLNKNEQLIYQRYRAGLGTLEDLDSARTSVSSALATQETRKESLAQQQRVLNVLLGQVSGSTNIPTQFPEVLLPLAQIPNQTLARRPDLQAAWQGVEVAAYDRQIAYKDMLPSISLQASYAGNGATPSQALFENPLWTLLGQLSAPIFQGGELKAAAEIAKLEEAQAFQVYRQTLLTAVQEVEDALGQERSLTNQITHIQKALKSAESNLTQYQMKYRSGLVTMLELLSVQQQTFDLQSQLDELIYERLSNRVTLGLALGLGVKHES